MGESGKEMRRWKEKHNSKGPKMLLDLPLDLLDLIVWKYCALPDGLLLDYELVRTLRLTCRALNDILNNSRRWARIARIHFASVQEARQNLISVHSFTDYIRFPFTVSLWHWRFDQRRKSTKNDTERLQRLREVSEHWFAHARPEVRLVAIFQGGVDIDDDVESLTIDGILEDGAGQSTDFEVEVRRCDKAR